jgi:hypothetical protein
MDHCVQSEFELYQYSDSDEDPWTIFDEFTIEDWQDWYSEDLLNVWMSIVEYHEEWYLPLRTTFNEFSHFVFETEDDQEEVITHEVQAMRNHPFVKNRNWENFFCGVDK